MSIDSMFIPRAIYGAASLGLAKSLRGATMLFWKKKLAAPHPEGWLNIRFMQRHGETQQPKYEDRRNPCVLLQ